MFKNHVLVESGKYEQALRHLDDVSHLLFDALEVRETKIELLLKLGRLTEAEEQIRELIAENAESKKYYGWLAQATGLAAGKNSRMFCLEPGLGCCPTTL